MLRPLRPALKLPIPDWTFVLTLSKHLHTQCASAPLVHEIDTSKLAVIKSTTPKTLISPTELVFGESFTDHMLSIRWSKDGWDNPKIAPYTNLSLDPASCVLHYAFECFEGMKAYKDNKGRARLFRPSKNIERMQRSAARISLPRFDGPALLELISKFVAVDERFIPAARGYSLYLRPAMIGTQITLNVKPPESALLFLIASPVGPFYPTGFNAISLEATDQVVRAWPRGVGHVKIGANYGPCVHPQIEAAKRGLQQNLWLFGNEQFVTEVGTMNMFVVIQNKAGQKELITAPLDGTILEGVTRDSILSLARERLVPEGMIISERNYTISELLKASTEGRLLEAFGAGTAAVISPIRNISWGEHLISCGLKADEEAGEIATRLLKWIEAIQYGDVEHEWSVVI